MFDSVYARGVARVVGGQRRLCGKLLRPLIPIVIEALEGHGHLDLDPEIKAKLLQMSLATIDRALQSAKGNMKKVRRRGVGGSKLQRSIPIRTFNDWGDPAPGHMEADLVSHSGPVARLGLDAYADRHCHGLD